MVKFIVSMETKRENETKEAKYITEAQQKLKDNRSRYHPEDK